MIKKLHLLPVRGQEQAAAEPVERQTLKTVSANHCHTEVHTQQGRPPLKNKDCDQFYCITNLELKSGVCANFTADKKNYI